MPSAGADAGCVTARNCSTICNEWANPMTDVRSFVEQLGSTFPAFQGGVSDLIQAVDDGLTIGGAGLFNIFLEHYDDEAILLQADFVSPPLTLTVPGLSGVSITMGEGDELDIDIAVVLDED